MDAGERREPGESSRGGRAPAGGRAFGASRQRRRPGIVGGLGPESTVDYYQRLVRRYRERTGAGATGSRGEVERSAEHGQGGGGRRH
jgi:hypothetical protein